jgi:hypothetical protein
MSQECVQKFSPFLFLSTKHKKQVEVPCLGPFHSLVLKAGPLPEAFSFFLYFFKYYILVR